MNYISDALNQLNDLNEEFDDFDDPDYQGISSEEKVFAQEIFNLLQTEIDESEKLLLEKFTSEKSLNNHFHIHCLGKVKEKTSTKTRIYYDFKDVSQYREYEKELNSSLQSAGPNVEIVGSLLDVETVIKTFRKLFEGNQYILFSRLCGLHNSSGEVALGLHSFASSKTNNYKLGNTIDLMILAPGNRTITLYPVDAYYLETKFNNIIKDHSDLDIQFKINH